MLIKGGFIWLVSTPEVDLLLHDSLLLLKIIFIIIIQFYLLFKIFFEVFFFNVSIKYNRMLFFVLVAQFQQFDYVLLDEAIPGIVKLVNYLIGES